MKSIDLAPSTTEIERAAKCVVRYELSISGNADVAFGIWRIISTPLDGWVHPDEEI